MTDPFTGILEDVARAKGSSRNDAGIKLLRGVMVGLCWSGAGMKDEKTMGSGNSKRSEGIGVGREDRRSEPVGIVKEGRYNRSIGKEEGFQGRKHNGHQLKWLVRDDTFAGGRSKPRRHAGGISIDTVVSVGANTRSCSLVFVDSGNQSSAPSIQHLNNGLSCRLTASTDVHTPIAQPSHPRFPVA